MSPPPSGAPRWNFTAAVAAWLFPGLGHLLLGETRRAGILAATIGVLWIAGFLIGGIGIFDWIEHPAWSVGQSLMAPSVVAGVVEARLRRAADAPWHQGPRPTMEPVYLPDPGQYTLPTQPPHPRLNPSYEPSYGRVDEQGVLYTALAGLLNLLAVMDVLYREAGRERRDAAPAPQPGGAA